MPCPSNRARRIAEPRSRNNLACAQDPVCAPHTRPKADREGLASLTLAGLPEVDEPPRRSVVRLPVTFRRPAVATADPLRRAGQAHLRRAGQAHLYVSAYEAQLSSARGCGACRRPARDRVRGLCILHTFEGRWVVSWPAATAPSLAVKSIVVVKVALPFVSF
jgi:hypothetical protein